jgi:hypothetical protein
MRIAGGWTQTTRIRVELFSVNDPWSAIRCSYYWSVVHDQSCALVVVPGQSHNPWKRIRVIRVHPQLSVQSTVGIADST